MINKIENLQQLEDLLKEYGILYGFTFGICKLPETIIKQETQLQIGISTTDKDYASFHIAPRIVAGFNLEKYENELGDEKLIELITDYFKLNNIESVNVIQSPKEGKDPLTGKQTSKDNYRISFYLIY